MSEPATHATKRKAANLSIDEQLLHEAKTLGLNLSRCAEAGIAYAVEQEKHQRWLADNASALESSNAYVESQGLPLSQHRQF